MSKVLLVTHWTGGDVFPFLRIGKTLLERGNQVVLFTHCVYEKQAKELGMEFVAWDTIEEWDKLQEYCLNSKDMFHNFQGLADIYEYYWSADEFMKQYLKMEPFCRHPEEKIIIARRDTSTAALLIAEKYKIPIMTVFLSPSYLNKAFSDETIFDKWITEQLNILRDTISLPSVSSWIEWCNSVKRHLALWPAWFSPPDSHWPKSVSCVGFPLDDVNSMGELPEEVLAFLGGGEAPVLISGGTSMAPGGHFYRAAIKACEQYGVRAIIVTDFRELLPETLPPNMIWYHFLNLEALMPKVKMIINHGGIGTVSGALRAGIPQLVMAHSGDAPFNAVLLQQIGVGEFLPLSHFKPKFILEGMERLLKTDVLDACQKYSLMIIENPGLEAACQVIEEVAGNQDFSLKNFDLGKSDKDSNVQAPPHFLLKGSYMTDSRKESIAAYLLSKRKTVR